MIRVYVRMRMCALLVDPAPDDLQSSYVNLDGPIFVF